jgi:Domain of unknown function (DUF4145)
MAEFDLTTTDGLLGAVAHWDEQQVREHNRLMNGEAPVHGPMAGADLGAFRGTYCGRCADLRRMQLVAADDRCQNLNPRYLHLRSRLLDELDQPQLDKLAFSVGMPPPAFTATCLECQTRVSLIVDGGPPVEVIVLGTRAPGMATAHTPDGVRYFLDQAYRARTRGAYTAAMVMYRAALEQLLHDQGFTRGRLVDRINQAVTAAPGWLDALDEELMTALRQLGNRAVHVGDGDISQQASFDHELVRDVEHLFVEVLDEVYEAPARREARRARFAQARQSTTPISDETAA